MKFRRLHKKLLGTLAACLLLAGTAGTALAAASGTAADTTISNSATVNYKVATIDQDPVTSNTATFKVDRHVDFTVSTDEVAAVAVTPGSTGNVLTFTVDNTGNDTFDFNLAAVDLSGAAAKFAAGNDNINASATAVYVESGATAGYQAGEDTATSIDDLAAGSSVKVYIVASFATGLSVDDIASYYLRATALDSTGAALTDDSGDADVTGTVQNVLATDDGPAPTDGDLDQIDSDYADYQVATASLSITKSSAVISDPINGTTNPKAIPGAVIEYTLTISNAASAATATDIAVSDSLNTEIATNGTLAFNTQYDATAGQGIVVGHPDYSGGALTEYTNTNADAPDEHGGVAADWNMTGGNTVTVTGITLDASESATIKFRVTVQ
jgi:hypothetical protein